MSLTAAQVGSIGFGEPAEGARGYHEGQVDAFMAEVAEEMRRLEAENQGLAEQLQHSDLAGHLRRLERDRDRALERVEVLRAELEKVRFDRPAPSAASEAPRLLELAEQTAEEHMTEARRVAGDLLYKASVEAARLTSDAELRASTVVADARHAHAERLAGLVVKRRETLARIDALCAEARERRAALIDELGVRLRGMDPKPAPR
ncbi:DivIVA domain-containing protein [Actinoplanes subglobosus]|uniref:Cell wall synthesis protein Wag31 n=1 Tax=Actinoplanes subglobosus TaxID=1547892 RepID=A0ABV8IU38_9ACTN